MVGKQKITTPFRTATKKINCLLFIFLCLSVNATFCQNSLPTSIDKELTFHSGLILPHTKNFGPKITQPSFMIEGVVSQQLNGFKPWHSAYGHPEMGLAVQYFRLRNDQIFGDAIALLPFCQFWVLKEKKTKGRIRFGAGIAYLTKPYNGATNLDNNVIGSHINNTTNLRFDLFHQFSSKLQGFLGVGILHFSNGSTSLPNLGINLGNVHAGIRWKGKEKMKEIEMMKASEKGRFLMSSHLTYARRESSAPGGPKFGLLVAGLGFGRMIGEQNRLSLQATYEYNSATRTFIDYIDSPTEFSNAVFSASRFMLSLEDEIRFGKVALVGELGAYVVKTAAIPFPVFTKLSVRYFFLEKKQFELYTTLSMKSHITVAEYISFGVGTTFKTNNKK